MYLISSIAKNAVVCGSSSADGLKERHKLSSEVKGLRREGDARRIRGGPLDGAARRHDIRQVRPRIMGGLRGCLVSRINHRFSRTPPAH